jgi:hypothetical protein
MMEGLGFRVWKEIFWKQLLDDGGFRDGSR